MLRLEQHGKYEVTFHQIISNDTLLSPAIMAASTTHHMTHNFLSFWNLSQKSIGEIFEARLSVGIELG